MKELMHFNQQLKTTFEKTMQDNILQTTRQNEKIMRK